MDSKLKLLEAKRETLYGRIQAIYRASKNSETDPSVRDTFLSSCETIDRIRDEFSKLLDEINEIQIQHVKDFTPNYQAWNAFEDLYCRIKGTYKKYLPSKSENPTLSKRGPKLPAIQIPSFDGESPQQWQLFYECFKSTIHDNPELSDADRVNYLVSKLDGKAASVFSGILPIGINYPLIWQALINRYQDRRAIASAYLDQIVDIEKITSATPQNLSSFIDKFSSSVSALKQLEMKQLTDYIFLHIALKKIDIETARAFEASVRDCDIPTYESFVKFINSHIKILDRTSCKPGLNSSQQNTAQVTKQATSLGTAVHKRGPARAHVTSDASRIHRDMQILTVRESDSIMNEKCVYCDETGHTQFYKCPKFVTLEPKRRYEVIKNYSCCLNCLSSTHKLLDCRSKHTCHYCGNKHHSLLHFHNKPLVENTGCHSDHSDQLPSNSVTQTATEPRIQPDLTRLALCNVSQNTTVLLATAQVNIADDFGDIHSVRCVIDPGAQTHLITTACCRKLNLNISSLYSSVVKGLAGHTNKMRGYTNLTFSSKIDPQTQFTIEPLVLDNITDNLPISQVNLSQLQHLKGVTMADENFHMPGEVELLLGAKIFPFILLAGRITGPPTIPPAIETSLGYILMGDVPTAIANENNSLSKPKSCNLCVTTDNPVEKLLQKFWQMEDIEPQIFLSPEEQDCENIFTSTTTRDKDGRYTVSLPFKTNPERLGISREIAKRRFHALERKLDSSPALRASYNSVITEYLEKGYLSPVTNGIDTGPSYYIPHHPVIRDDKSTTKIRIVLDASCKTDNLISLNDILHIGQNLQADLFVVLLNARLYKYAICADVRQMYLQVGVVEHHRRFQRILFRFDSQCPLNTYEFNRVAFGLRCSPYLALRVLRKLATDEQNTYPHACNIVRRDVYMDDVVTSVESISDAKQLIEQLLSLFKSGGFELLKWSSNSQALLSHLPEALRSPAIIDFEDTNTLKILGMQWLPASDVFSFKITKPDAICTKRSILSTIARLWDILGFVAPVILFAKLLIKSLWLAKLNWDDSPPPPIVEIWEKFVSELPLLEEIVIPRHLGVISTSAIRIIGFADASEKAYGAVVYLHVSTQGHNAMHLLCAKSKVSPLKVVSIARLELCAAVLLSKLILKVINTYSSRHNIEQVMAFSDSTVALCWIHSSPHRWQTFVANRVAQIQTNISKDTFYHIPGIENPSDCLSRGLTPAQLIEHPQWLKGPSWAQSHPSSWPVEPFSSTASSSMPEEKSVSLPVCASDPPPIIIVLASRVSSWMKLLRIVVYMHRFMKILPRKNIITASDLEFAESVIIKQVQLMHFAEDKLKLDQGKSCSPALRKLAPLLHDGLIRVGGRLANSDLEFERKHPILLPSHGHIIDLIIDHYHRKNCHTGPSLLMSILRQKYWILAARNIIRNRVHKCNFCYKVQPKINYPFMADLPAARVRETKAFGYTGTDYAGPLPITLARRRGARSQKAYICLFICLTTKAIHIELASDLSTESFLGAFKRFLSRRGPVACMYSDNGTNYIGAKSYLNELYAFLTSESFNTAFAQEVAENRIQWKLNPPCSPHFGGIWETNVKALKAHLYRVIGTQILTYEELLTVLTQIECLLNSRPLSLLSSDPSEPAALTPAHFLTLTPLQHLPAADVSNEKPNLLKRQQFLDHLVQSYWKRWSMEYLHTLQTREKWNTNSNPVQIGTVVLIHQDNLPPLRWPLGVITDLYPGKDGIVRVVSVKTKSGQFKRPVVRLCPLPSQ